MDLDWEHKYNKALMETKKEKKLVYLFYETGHQGSREPKGWYNVLDEVDLKKED